MSTSSMANRRFRASFSSGLAIPQQLKENSFMEAGREGFALL